MKVRPVAVVVDESKPFRLYLASLLERMNLEVLMVESAAEALEISRVTRPQLFTMDMNLPDMDGLETLRSIRKDEELAGLPVIMISSDQDRHRQWEALSLDCIDVLDKPVDVRRLHKAVQRCNPYPGRRRRHLRATCDKEVGLRHRGKLQKFSSASLSERGIFLPLNEPLPKGTHVEIELPLSSAENMQLSGAVIYCKAQSNGSSSDSPGVAIKFSRLTGEELEILSALVEELLIGDYEEEQAESLARSI